MKLAQRADLAAMFGGWLMILAGFCMFMVMPFLAAYMPAIDGYLRPAASPMVLTGKRDAGIPGWTEFDGRSARIRPECSFVRIEWFRGDRDGQHVPAAVKLGPPTNRPNGVFTFTGWAVDVVPPSDFEEQTFSDVLHQCRIFTTLDASGQAVGGIDLPWLTRSPFWR